MFLGENFAAPFSIFDTHAHYDDEAFDEIRQVLLEGIGEKGVGYIINNATDLDASAKKCIEIAEQFENCYAAVGIHPETVENSDVELDETRLKTLATNKKVLAIGEIGLDYYHSTEKKDLQKQIFYRQCTIANELGLPVIVHDREAHFDTLEILKACKPKGSLHCFSGSVETAKEIINLGLYIGIGGVITFKNARKAVEVVEQIPLESILLETDAPYLAPVPFRGKLCNSAMIYYTAQRIAEIKGVSVEKVISTTTENAKRLFNVDT